ncbi:MAG: hypothetical protein U0K92_00320 [Treponema sp.]|nr:hypothetical protein [Treponema sp.]
MKISKKIFLAAITAAAVAFVGCGMSEGDLDGKGSKWERTIEKDSTKVGVEKPSPAYGRAFSQLGTKETVQSIKTLVTVYKDGMDGWVLETAKDSKEYTVAKKGDSKVDEKGKTINATEVHGVVGFMFDLHKTKAKADAESYKEGDTLYDFIIVGYRPSDKGFYVERYENVPEGSMDDYVTTGGFGVATKCFTKTSESIAFEKETYDSAVTTETTEDGENVHKFTVTIEQDEAGTYTIKIGNITVGTYEGIVTDEKSGYAIGGAGVYANAPIGTIVKAKFESDGDATVGLFLEPVEE